MRTPTFEEVFGTGELVNPKIYSEAELLKEDIYTLMATAEDWGIPDGWNKSIPRRDMSKRSLVNLMMHYQLEVHQPLLNAKYKKNRWQRMGEKVKQ